MQDLYRWIDAGNGDVLFWLIVAIIVLEGILKWMVKKAGVPGIAGGPAEK